MDSLNNENQAAVFDFHLDGLYKIDTHYLEGTVYQIYPLELQLNKSNTTGTEALF